MVSSIFTSLSTVEHEPIAYLSQCLHDIFFLIAIFQLGFIASDTRLKGPWSYSSQSSVSPSTSARLLGRPRPSNTVQYAPPQGRSQLEVGQSTHSSISFCQASSHSFSHIIFHSYCRCGGNIMGWNHNIFEGDAKVRCPYKAFTRSSPALFACLANRDTQSTDSIVGDRPNLQCK